MVWQLHRAWIPPAWSTALDADADFTSARGGTRRGVSSKIVATQIACARCDAGGGNSLLLSGATCQPAQRWSTSGDRFYFPTTRKRKQQVSGLATRMSHTSLFGEKNMTKGTPIQFRDHEG